MTGWMYEWMGECKDELLAWLIDGCVCVYSLLISLMHSMYNGCIFMYFKNGCIYVCVIEWVPFMCFYGYSILLWEG